MTTFKERSTRPASPEGATAKTGTAGRYSLAEVVEILAGVRLPLRFSAYDGSSAGPPDAPFGLTLQSWSAAAVPLEQRGA